MTDTALFDEVRAAIGDAVLVAWDGCHKIYLAMDDIEADEFREHYPCVVEDSPDVMLAEVGEWWDVSCSLRFVSAVHHDAVDPNAGYRTLIAQGADEEEE